MLSRFISGRHLTRPRLALAAGSAAVLGIAALSIAFSFLALENYRSNVSNRDDSRAILIAAKDVEGSLFATHAASQDYFDQGDDAALAQYFEASAIATSRLGRLEEVTSGTEHEQALKAAVPGAFAIMDEAIRRAVRGEQVSSIADYLQRADSEKQIANAESALERVSTSENDRVAALTATTNKRAIGVAFGLSLLVVINLGLLVVLALYLRARSHEATLRQANDAKDRFVGFVSHELRNPIASILSGASLLQRRKDVLSEEEREEVLTTISDEAERLEQQVSNMLMMARQEAAGAELEPLLLHRLIPRIADVHRRRFPARQVELRVDDGLAPIEGNASFVEEITLNLMNNAEKYGDAAAPIEIEARDDHDRVRVTVLSRGGSIDPRAARTIFQPFVRGAAEASKPGAGLGLAVCEKLIELQHGHIWAEPREGGGAAFAFTLPKAAFELELLPEPSACCG